MKKRVDEPTANRRYERTKRLIRIASEQGSCVICMRRKSGKRRIKELLRTYC